MDGRTEHRDVREPRRDRAIHERVHDTYKTRAKLPEPTVCPKCGAVFHKGRWTWETQPAQAHAEMCPACHRIQDKYPAGFLTLEGPFLQEHKEELLHLARNEETKEKGEHPLHRIIHMEEKDESILITTTDIHLPRRIGEALRRAYEGELDFHYIEESNILRVRWKR